MSEVGNLLKPVNKTNESDGKSYLYLNTEKAGNIRFVGMTKDQIITIASENPNWRDNVVVAQSEARTVTMEDGREVDYPAGHYCYYSNMKEETLDL